MLKKFSCLIILFFLLAGQVSAAAIGQFNSGLKTTGDAAYGQQNYTGSNAEKFVSANITKIIQAVLSVVGLVFLGLMIYGGYKWMLARGNDSDVNTAKSIIINAVIGLVIVMAAYAITSFIGNKVINNTINIQVTS